MASRCRPSASPTPHPGGWGSVKPLVFNMPSTQRAWTSLKGEGLGGRRDFAGPRGQGGCLLLPLGTGKREVAQVRPEHVEASVDRCGPYRRQSF